MKFNTIIVIAIGLLLAMWIAAVVRIGPADRPGAKPVAERNPPLMATAVRSG